MEHEVSVELLNRYRNGDEDAARALFDRYATRLIALARTRLSSQLRRRIDPDDVIQSVYRSFFRTAAEKTLDCQRSGDLWRLLVAMTLNKLRMQARRHTAGVRDVRNEESISLTTLGATVPTEQLSHEPRPEDVFALAELLETVMSSLTSRQRKMLELRLQNHQLEEIAEQLECSERTVRRVLDKIKDRCQSELKTNAS